MRLGGPADGWLWRIYQVRWVLDRHVGPGLRRDDAGLGVGPVWFSYPSLPDLIRQSGAGAHRFGLPPGVTGSRPVMT